MKFFDRKNELDIIKGAVSQPNCFVVVTGRRRIGKTRLIREALKEKAHIELFIPRKRLTLVMENIKEDIEEQTGYSPTFKNFKEVFEYLFRTEKKPVFIDEISNLDFVETGAFSDLQRLLDKEKDNWNIRLVVDGSYISVMKKIFQDRKEPLFGRATYLLDLQPLPVKDSVKMCMKAGFIFSDALEAYSLLGGVPRYLELLSQYRDITELKKRIFTPGSIFLTEGENILIQEFGASWDTYFSIMEVIASGKLGPSAIANELGMPIQMIPKYLDTLLKLKLIERKRPLLGKSSHVRYRIKDPFIQLWFDVCYPRIGHYRDGTSTVSQNLITSAIGKGMERFVIEMLSQSEVLPFKPNEIGSWWNRRGDEIDVLIYSKRPKMLLAGEVKWSNKVASLKDTEQLLRNVNIVDWNNDSRTEYAFIISKSGFSKSAREFMELKNIMGLELTDLQGILIEDKKQKWIAISS